MGCTESIPIDMQQFDIPHKTDPSIEVLGIHHEAYITNHKQELIMKQKLRKRNGNPVPIQTIHGKPFGNNLCFKEKNRHRSPILLLSGTTTEPIAVCLRSYTRGKAFKIYRLSPNYHNQKPSENTYDNKTLYSFGYVKRINSKHEIYIERTCGDPQLLYTVVKTRKSGRPARLITKQSLPAGLIESMKYEGIGWSYKVTISPGIDPCFMMFICAICHKIDEDDSRRDSGDSSFATTTDTGVGTDTGGGM